MNYLALQLDQVKYLPNQHTQHIQMMNNVITSGYIVVDLKLIVRKHVLVQKPGFGTFIILGYVSF